jgi:uracil-DNA glycosylase
MSIAIVGEAWGEREERQKLPFVGSSGWELTKMLEAAGIERRECLLTNVFNFRPKDNDMSWVCGPKTTAIERFPKLLRGKTKEHRYHTGDYVRAEFLDELIRLEDEIVEANPNVVIALGNTALWAFTGKTTITKLRGTTLCATYCAEPVKVLPTYHPAAIMRQYQLRPICIMDLQKAAREAEFPEIRRSPREIWINPTLEDIYDFHRRYIEGADLLSVDIETSGRDVTCIGLAPSKERALVIPFHDPRRNPSHNYWESLDAEREVWRYLRGVLENSHPRKVFQNGLYDTAFLYRSHGIRVDGFEEDTMLLHHALYPESPKALGFLGSVYCDEGNWKDMRKHKGTKRED